MTWFTVSKVIYQYTKYIVFCNNIITLSWLQILLSYYICPELNSNPKEVKMRK